MKTLTTLIAVFVIGTSAAQFENATNPKYRVPDVSVAYITVEEYLWFFTYRVVDVKENCVYTVNANVNNSRLIRKFKGEHPADIKVGDIISLATDGDWRMHYKYSKDAEYIVKKEDWKDYLEYIKSL